jgi:hypothetical protein
MLRILRIASIASLKNALKKIRGLHWPVQASQRIDWALSFPSRPRFGQMNFGINLIRNLARTPDFDLLAHQVEIPLRAVHVD